MNTATLTKTENLSGIVQALEGAHALIQEKTGAPRATILVTRKTGRTMGHFTHAKVWKSGEDSFQEIMVSANYFERGARAVLGTLLHEVAHSIDLQNGIQGTSGDGYHNKKFKATAESLGPNDHAGQGYRMERHRGERCVRRAMGRGPSPY
jgi:hypothetical protein